MLNAEFKDSSLRFKEVSFEELEIIKTKIRNQAKKDYQRSLRTYILAFSLTLIVIWLFFLAVF